MTPPEDKDKAVLKMRPGRKALLLQLCEEDKRSMSSEVEWLIEMEIERRKELCAPGPGVEKLG